MPFFCALPDTAQRKFVTLLKDGAKFDKICYIFPLDNMRDLWDNKGTKGKRCASFPYRVQN